MSKRLLKFGIPAVLLVLFVILTAVLCSSTVFHGKYKGENSLYTGHKYEVVFSGDNVTYTLSSEGKVQDTYSGFYEKTTDGIVLNLTSPNFRLVELKRKNVFTLTQTGYSAIGSEDNLVEMELKCDGAIWLQIFYSTGTVASAVFLIVQIVRQRKVKK